MGQREPGRLRRRIRLNCASGWSKGWPARGSGTDFSFRAGASADVSYLGLTSAHGRPACANSTAL